MLRIAVCDDESYFSQLIKKYIETFLWKKELEFRIDIFNSGEELLEIGSELINYNIFFLDIDMEKINGVRVAQKIREYGFESYIVFVTAYIDYSLEGYKVDAIRYLLKNNLNFEATIHECMEAIFEKMNYVVSKKIFSFNEGEKKVALERILYIESRLHKLEFHIIEEEMKIYTMYGTLNELEKEMKEFRFVRIHQSYLVNLKHIKEIKDYQVILSNNEQLVIPKARYRKVKDTFISYKGEL